MTTMTETTEMLAELDSTIKLLEARLPANMEREENTKLVKRLERDMAGYFRDLETAIPMSDVEALYYKRVKQE